MALFDCVLIGTVRDNSKVKDRAMARALIGGGGGGIFIYSCYARLISFEINPNDN